MLRTIILSPIVHHAHEHGIHIDTMTSSSDTDDGFNAKLTELGLQNLDAGDITFLRAAYERNKLPMALPTGFTPATPPRACALFIDPCGPL